MFFFLMDVFVLFIFVTNVCHFMDFTYIYVKIMIKTCFYRDKRSLSRCDDDFQIKFDHLDKNVRTRRVMRKFAYILMVPS
jgi:hypothetical protein